MNRKLRNTLVLVAACLTLAWCIPSAGQVLKGSISGTVVDPQGAVVPSAQVKATEIATGKIFTTTTDNSGLFRFSLIPAGSYKVEVSAARFKTSVESDVQVVAGSDKSLGNVKLSVGGKEEIVEVTAAPPLMDTSTPQVTNTFTGTTLQTFAGIQENQGLDNLALFVPGVVSARDNGFSNTNGGAGFSVNGLRGRNNDQQIDGQNNNDNSVGGPGLFVSDTEFVQQYVLVTNNFGPEYGRNAGSVVNIITKQGGNAWHGSLYATENNSKFNSLDNFDKRFNFNPATGGSGLTKPARLNNEFGGFTIGGPVVKNRMFVFGGFNEQIISTIAQFHSDSLTPTPAGLAKLNGCFPASNSLTAFNKYGPFAISAGSPVATKVPDDPTDPNSPRNFVNLNVGACAGVQFGGVSRFLSAPVHQFNWTLRNDVQLGGNDNLMARYIFNRGNFFNLDFGDAAAGYPVNVPALSQAILLSETHNFSARMVNEARVGFNRLNVDFGGNSIGTVPTADNVDKAVARVTIQASGFLAMGAATNLPQSRIVNTWQAQDNWNLVVGKHTFKAGVNWTYQRSPNIFLPLIDGAYRFSNWTNFMNNTPNRVQIAQGNPSLDFREYDTFAYGGDDWKIRQNLTLNLGLTWTYYGQPANLFHDITTPRENNSASPPALWAKNEPAGTNFAGQAIPIDVRTFPIFPAPKNSFGPSVGFAYQPQWGGFITGHGKTTIRGGYRFLYDPPFYNIYINMSTSTPEVFLQTFLGGAAASKPLNKNPLGPNVRSDLQTFLTPGVFDPRQFAQTSMTSNFGPDKVHSYSLGFEREITKNSAVEVRYAGNRAYDLFQSVNANPFIADLKTNYPTLVPAGATPCSSTQSIVPQATGRANCNLGIQRLRNNGGYSYYNSLQAEFRANNLFKQLTVRSAYTWSKNLDNVSEIFATFGGGNTIAFAQNPLNTTTGEYSFSGLDIPHQWTILVTEQLPFFKEQHGLIGHLLGGWGFSANYVLASGQRYTPAQVFAANFTDTFPVEFGGVNPNCHVSPGTCPFNFYDLGFIGNFNSGVDSARPFLGNLKAPANAVGVYAGDACLMFSLTGADPLCSGNPNQLVSLNAIGQSGCETDATKSCPFTAVTKDQVRYIVNSFTAQQVFGTPFGSARRNLSQDAITNIANLSILKKFKITERTSFEFRTTMLNAFNHPNFQTVDPFIEDAGLAVQGTGFGVPSLTNTVPFGYASANTRIIYIGGTLRF